MRKIIRATALLCAALIIFAAVPCVGAQKVVRVGFQKLDGYFNIDESGKRSGFGYEYLQNLCLYTDWKCEYIGYDKTWAELLEMLSRGEIDMLSPLQKTAERETQFYYPSVPMASSAILLVTGITTADAYKMGDAAAYNGMRIGLLKNINQANALASFAAQRGFSYIAVTFDTASELRGALDKGSVDALLETSLTTLTDEVILEQFDMQPFYMAVNKSNTELALQLESAVATLTNDNPTLANSLMKKYYSSSSGNAIVFSAKELEYIKKCQSEGKTFTAALQPDRTPFSYFENGEMCGINADIAREIIKRTALNIKIIASPTPFDYDRQIKSGEIDILLDVDHDYNRSEKEGYYLTQPYNSTQLSFLTRKNTSKIKRLAAAEFSNAANADFTNTSLSGVSVDVYPDTQSCIKAVKDGRADAQILYSECAKQAIYNDERNILVDSLQPFKERNFAIGISKNCDALLASIINKAALSVNQKTVNDLQSAYTQYPMRPFSFIGYLYSNTIYAVIFMLALLLTVILLALFLYRRKSVKMARARAYEFERFISYVCAMNDETSEIDMVGRTRTVYSVINGKVVTETEPSEQIYEKYLNILHPDDIKKVQNVLTVENVGRLIESRQSVNLEVRIKDENGEYRWNSFMVMGVARDDEHPCNFMLFCRDIDDEKREEKEKNDALIAAYNAAEHANGVKSRFLSRMSHEVRTPLNAMIGYMAIAKQSLSQSAKISECITKSEISAKQLLGIINEVLDVSALESGNLCLRTEPFNLKDLLKDIKDLFYDQFARKNVRFEIVPANVRNEKLCGDVMRIKQILTNILSNSYKFTPEGGSVQLIVTEKTKVGNTAHFAFAVTDTGIGMPKDFLSRAFVPFEKADNTLGGGTGLGLSVVNGLVTMMGGSVRAVSTEGNGSTFNVELPIVIDSEKEPKRAEKNLKNLYILVVDNDNNTCIYTRDILSSFGMRADCTNNIDDARKMIANAQTPYSAYIVDEKLIDGFSEIVKGDNPRLPVIVTTYNEENAQENAKRWGAAKIIAKPVFSSSLFDSIVNIFEKHSSQASHGSKAYDFGGAHVLLAEDNAMNTEIAVEILHRVNFAVDCACDGQRAAEMFEKSAVGYYKAVLLDIQMPIYDGYETAQKIRASERDDAESVPIIALTANAFPRDVTEALSSGMNDHVSKPIDTAILYRKLAKYINGI